jgi:histone H3/H4
MRRDEVAINIRPVKRVVRDYFKAACHRRGESMIEVINAFMKEYGRIDRETSSPMRPRGKVDIEAVRKIARGVKGEHPRQTPTLHKGNET